MNKNYKVAVLISGRGSNLGALIQATQQYEVSYDICVVLSDKKNAAGLQVAADAGIQAVHVPRRAKELTTPKYNEELASTLIPFKPDLVVLAGYMRVLTEEFIAKFPKKIINIHPSLLPSFRGLHAQQQALAAGAKFAGCTVHYVIPEVDAGEIIAQSVVPVLADDTEETLSQRILKQEHKLLPAVVNMLATGQQAASGATQNDQLISIRPLSTK